MSTKSSGLFSPRRQLNFIELPFARKTFYVDVRSNAVKTKLTERIKCLGGEIETFLTKDISLLITDKNENVSPENGAVTKKRLSTGLPLSRGQALLLKASTANQENGKGSSSQTLIQNAVSLGIKTQAPATFLRNTTKHLAKVKEQRKVADDYEGLSPIVWENEKENAPSCYIKVEDQTLLYRPLFKQLDFFPSINYSDTGCPFDTGVVLPKNNENIQAKKKAVGGAVRGGYCESCDHWYKCTLREHLNSSRHRDFVESIENFQSLNKLTEDIPGISKFMTHYGLKNNVMETDCDKAIGDNICSLQIGDREIYPYPVQSISANSSVSCAHEANPAERQTFDKNLPPKPEKFEDKELTSLDENKHGDHIVENMGMVVFKGKQSCGDKRIVLGEINPSSGNCDLHHPRSGSDYYVVLDSVHENGTSASGYDKKNKSFDMIPQDFQDSKECAKLVMNSESKSSNSSISVHENDKENVAAMLFDKYLHRTSTDNQLRKKDVSFSKEPGSSLRSEQPISEKSTKEISFNDVLESIMNDSVEDADNELLDAEIAELTTKQVHMSESQPYQENVCLTNQRLPKTDRSTSYGSSNNNPGSSQSRVFLQSNTSIRPSSEILFRGTLEKEPSAQIEASEHEQKRGLCSSEYQVPSTFPYQWTEPSSLPQVRPGSMTFSSSTSFGENGVNDAMMLLHSDQSSQWEPKTINYASLNRPPSTCSGRASVTSHMTSTTCGMIDHTDLSLVASKQSVEYADMGNFGTVESVSFSGRNMNGLQDTVDDSYSSATERFSTKSYPSVGLSNHLNSVSCSTAERRMAELQDTKALSESNGSCSSVYSKINNSENPLRKSTEHLPTRPQNSDVNQNVIKPRDDIESRHEVDNIFEMFGRIDDNSEPTPVKQAPAFSNVFSVANPDYSNITEDSMPGTSSYGACDKTHAQSPLVKEGFKPFGINQLNATVAQLSNTAGNVCTPEKDTMVNLQEKILDSVANSGSTIRNWLLPNGDCDSLRSEGTLNTPVQKKIKQTDRYKSPAKLDFELIHQEETECNHDGQELQSAEASDAQDSHKVAEWIQKQVFDPMLDSESSLQGFEDVIMSKKPKNLDMQSYCLKDRNIFDSLERCRSPVNIAEEITHKSCSEANAESVHGDLTREESDWSDTGTSITDCTLENFRPSQNTCQNPENKDSDTGGKSAYETEQTGFRFTEANRNKDWDSASVKSSLSSTLTSRGIKISGLKSLMQPGWPSTPRLDTQTDSVSSPADLLLQGLENCVKTSDNNDTKSVTSLASAAKSEIRDCDNNSTKSASRKCRNTKVTQKPNDKVSSMKKRAAPVTVLPKPQTMAFSVQNSNIQVQTPELQMDSPNRLQSVDFLASPVQSVPVNNKGLTQSSLPEHPNFLSNNSNFLLQNWQNQQMASAPANSVTSGYTMQFSDMSHEPSAQNEGFSTIRLDDIAENSNGSYNGIGNVPISSSQNAKPSSGVKSKRKVTAQKKLKLVTKGQHTHNIPSYTNSPIAQQGSDMIGSNQVFNQQYSAYAQSLPTNHSQALTRQAFYHPPSSQTILIPAERPVQPHDYHPKSHSVGHSVQSNMYISHPDTSSNSLAPQQFQTNVARTSGQSPHYAVLNNRSVHVANTCSYGQLPSGQSSFNIGQNPCTASQQMAVNRMLFNQADMTHQSLTAIHSTQPSMTAVHGYPLLGFMGSPIGTLASPGFQAHPHLAPAGVYSYQQTQLQQAQLAHFQQQQDTYNAVQTGDTKLTFRKVPVQSQNQTFEQGQQQTDLTKYWNVKKAGDCRLVFRVNPAVKRKVDEETPLKDPYHTNLPDVNEENYTEGPVAKRRRCLIY